MPNTSDSNKVTAAEYKAFSADQRAQAAEEERDQAKLETAVVLAGRSRGMVEEGYAHVAKEVATVLSRRAQKDPLLVGDTLDQLRAKGHYLFNENRRQAEAPPPASGRTAAAWLAVDPKTRLEQVNEATRKGRKVK